MFGRTLVTFGLASFVGPTVALLGRAVKSDATVPFFYELALFLWPAQVFAIMETSIGRTAAVALAVSVNTVLFLIVGLLRYWLRDSRLGLIGLSTIVCAALIGISAWSSGYALRYLNFGALAVAMGGFLALIWLSPATRTIQPTAQPHDG